MVTSLPSPESLYAKVVALADTAPPVLHLSPTTFKSIIATVCNLLHERAIAAQVWVKLPRAEAWHTELDAYAAAGSAPAIYRLRSVSPAEADASADRTDTALQTIPIAADGALKGDYFLVVVAAELQLAILAHRLTSQELAIARANATIDPLGETESYEHNHRLVATYLLDPATITGALSEITQRAIAACLADDHIPTLEQWPDALADMTPQTIDLNLVSTLLVHHLQKQDDTWQRYDLLRQQTDLLESLRSENAILSQSLQERDEFLNTMGQELRAPLTAIRTALSLLRSASLRPAQRQRYMDLIHHECERQSNLIKNLLDLVRLDHPADDTAIERLYLADVVPAVVSTYQPLAEEQGIMLAYTVPNDLPPVKCSSAWVKQIVINLLDNGIKFTPRGGQVWVRARTQNETVQLEVRDTGMGIHSSEMPHIFERFYRGRPSAEDSASGSGLGLTVVQQLLKHCGGSISVQSKLGEGTTFLVSWPIAIVSPTPTMEG